LPSGEKSRGLVPQSSVLPLALAISLLLVNPTTTTGQTPVPRRPSWRTSGRA
jgi:hypothetical protein